MKKLVSILILCLGCFGFLEAQDNIWRLLNCDTPFLGAASNGDLFAMDENGGLLRSQDEGETWTQVNDNHMYQCIAFSPEGRIFVFPSSNMCLQFSDDGGDTWQATTTMASCAMYDVGGLCAPSNDIVVVWATNGETYWTTDGGETWNFAILEADDGSELSDMIVNAEGDVYVSVWSYSDGDTGIFHSTLSDMGNWEIVAGEELNIRDMAFDPEGNVVACGYHIDGSSIGYQHTPGFYLFDGTTLAISDGGIVYRPHFDGNQAVLSYSTDHGEHFTDLGEHLPLVDIAPGGDAYFLIKGYDNHLYFNGGGEYWKCIPDADEITNYGNYVPLVHEGNDRQKWNVVYILANDNYPNDYHTEIQSIRDNINLDGVDYKLVWTESVYDSKRIAGAVREEDRRVYYRRKLSQSYEEEVLLYDFNLTVGDTVTVNWFGQPLTVIEETEVEVDGTMRRKLVFGPEEYWIEGVGSSYGFLNSGYENWMGSFVHLLCYHENGDLVWDNESFDDCVMNSDGAPASFAPQGAEWYFHVLSQGPITEPPFYYLKSVVTGTEEIQGHLCSVIDDYRYVYEEDDVVYMYNHSTDSFTVMYDFNAEEGDTWYCNIEEGFTGLVTVDSVGSVTWNGHTYRTQYVTGYIPDEGFLIYDGRIIEGIGYEKGVFPHEYVFDGTEYEYMRCYLEDGELLYHEGSYDCDYVPGNNPPEPLPEWYYEIENEDGSITYQHLECAGDTIVNDKIVTILIRTNTLYDKGKHAEVTHEYIYEEEDVVYWWNSELQEFTVLYDYSAQAGDSWEIKVGTEAITMNVVAVENIEYEGRTFRVLQVSDDQGLFNGNIVCGIGHLTSFFPERLMGDSDRMRVEGLRCYWVGEELIFKLGDEDCDAIYSDIHGVDELNQMETRFNVYPNPTDGVLYVETFPETSPINNEYRITNLMGQTVLTGSLNAETQRIDVSALPHGMYFITISGTTMKFVVR